MERTAGFHHVTLVAADAGRAEQLYGELLGLALVARIAGTATDGDELVFSSGRGLQAGAPGTLVRVLVRPGARRGRWGVGGVHHVALGVDERAALLKWKRRLTDAGVRVSGPYDRGWFHSIYFADGDGQVLEIATAGPGYDRDEPIDRLGERLIMPAPSQLRGGRDEAAIAAETHGEPVPVISPDMAITGLHHVTGLTDDIARADAFYREMLGLRVVKRSVNQDDGVTPHWFWASWDGARVAPHSSYTLFAWQNSTYRMRAGYGQTHRIAFRAPDDDALHAFRERLRARGMDADDVVVGEHYSSLEFAAPDGQLLALATEAPGFAAAAMHGAARTAGIDAEDGA